MTKRENGVENGKDKQKLGNQQNKILKQELRFFYIGVIVYPLSAMTVLPLFINIELV